MSALTTGAYSSGVSTRDLKEFKCPSNHSAILTLCAKLFSNNRIHTLKMLDPCGNLSNEWYKLLYGAISRIILIQQMNACASDNTRRKMLSMLVKVMGVDTCKGGKLLNLLLCNTWQRIHGDGGSTRKNVIFSNSLWTNSEYPISLKTMSI